MKGKEKRYFHTAVIATVLLVFLIIPICFYIVLSLGFPPVIGNLLAARNMTTYAAQAHPEWTPEGGWAGYNLVDGGYDLSFAEGSQSHSLGYAKGVVQDKEREKTLREELEISKALRINGLWIPDRYTTYWGARWPFDAPDRPRITVDVTFYDSADAPVPDECAMREKMVDKAMQAYEALAPVTPIHSFSVRYCHRGVKKQHNVLVWNIIRAELSEGESLTQEDILSGTLSVR